MEPTSDNRPAPTSRLGRLVRTLRNLTALGLLTLSLGVLALWARSYRHFDWWGPGVVLVDVTETTLRPQSGFVCESANGVLAIWHVGNLRGTRWWAWSIGRTDANGNYPADYSPRVTGDRGESARDGFRAKTFPNGSFQGSMPDWFAFSIFVGIAFALKPKPRLRFSLSDLLVLMTFSAMLLAGVAGLTRLTS